MALDTAGAPTATEGSLGPLSPELVSSPITFPISMPEQGVGGTPPKAGGRPALRPRFGLVLMVTHACNLRCSYCYVGAKRDDPMPAEVGRAAIERALASIAPGGAAAPGGTLDLGFFGGEPLLEAALVNGLIDYARDRARPRGITVSAGLTTNGTVATADAWSLICRPDVSLALSHDGLPEVHNRHRRFADGTSSSARVLRTMERLAEAGKDFRVVMVVRPDNVRLLSAGMLFLQAVGVRCLEPSLDLWTRWSADDVRALEAAVADCAQVWRDGLPGLSVSWFDGKAARLAGLAMPETTRCAFGDGEVAVAPSGRLYPCERLIGEDAEENPVRLAGDVFDGADFLEARRARGRAAERGQEGGERSALRCVERGVCAALQPRSGCAECAIRGMCETDCRCSNYVRTGDVSLPDGLLCALNRACVRETAAVLQGGLDGAVGHLEPSK